MSSMGTGIKSGGFARILKGLKDAAHSEQAAAVRAGIALALCPAVTFYLFEFYTHDPFRDMQPKAQILNIIFFELLAVFLAGIFGRVRTALMVESGLFMAAGLINAYVLKFRSSPIAPWDIFSLSTAASVADNFDYTPDRSMLSALGGFLILMVLESRVKAGIWHRRIVGFLTAGVAGVFLGLFTVQVQNEDFVRRFGLYDKLFTPAVINKRDGNAVAFLMELQYLAVEKPVGYSAEAAGELYESFGSGELARALEDPKSVDRPNIIVIMDEAFSDLAVLGEFKTNEDYMPFFHSMQQKRNAITGYLNVSVLGGNTANTEFEFLTGHSMAFLPQGSVAYQQYLKNGKVGLPAYLKALGYTAVALHPYNASGWERDRVYPLLGFERFLSLKNFGGAKRIRKYVSDQSCVDKIIDLYERKKEGEPLFVFNVTMQNHSGYDDVYVNFAPEIEMEGISSKALNCYLSLIKKTDEALERLIEYFSGQQEKTLILFFGDHQPAAYVSNPILRSNGADPNALSLEQELQRYKVPYLIWGNFELPGEREEGFVDTSVNYLALKVLENCSLPLPEYQSFLREAQKEYPVISAMQIRDAQGNLAGGEDGKTGEAQILKDYRALQYYLLFDNH